MCLGHFCGFIGSAKFAVASEGKVVTLQPFYEIGGFCNFKFFRIGCTQPINSSGAGAFHWLPVVAYQVDVIYSFGNCGFKLLERTVVVMSVNLQLHIRFSYCVFMILTDRPLHLAALVALYMENRVNK